MRPVIHGISARIIIPIFLIIFALSIVLYFFVLRSVSEFAENSITSKLVELRKDVYDICELKNNGILLSGRAGDEKFMRIQKSHAISAIEDFARNNVVDVAIRHEDRYIYFSNQFPPALRNQEGNLLKDVMPGLVYGDYFIAWSSFEPWGWDIILFKNRRDFSYLHKYVNRIYGITGLIIGILASGLFYYMHRTVARPLRMVAEPLREGRYPDYKGIAEFEFLSESIREMMQRLQQEAEIRISEEKLRSIIEIIMVGIAVTNPEGIVLESNSTLARMLGYKTRDEFVGRSVLDHYYDPEERPNVIALARMNMLRDYEFRLKRVDGSFFWASLNMVPHQTESGPQFICSLVDVSARRMVEEELINSHAQLQSLTRHLTLVREEERRKIAMEIHDELGQELTALNMYISTLARQLPEGRSDLSDKAGDMKELVNRTIKVVQRLVNELRPGVLDALGLKAAIENDISRYRKNSDIKMLPDLSIGDDVRSAMAVAMYRIWQEAMTNVIRHSGATEVRVGLFRSGRHIVLEISDNGMGIDESLIDHPRSFGIVGMKEQVKMIDGSFYIGSNGGGTTVRVEAALA
jgi:PAS domain S-box-containing protein